MKPSTACTVFILLTTVTLASAHIWDDWTPPENRTSMIGGIMGTQDPFTNPPQPTKAEHDAMIRAGGQWKLGSECINLLDKMPLTVFKSEKLYTTGDQPYTAAQAFKQTRIAQVAVLDTIALLKKDGFKLGEGNSAIYARALDGVFGGWGKPVLGNADVDALRKLFHAGTGIRTKAEEAFCDRLRAELDVLRQKHVQCAFVVYTVGNAEQKAKAALYLKIMGYVVE